MTRAQKCIKVFADRLPKLGWKPVGSKESGIFKKNDFALVIYPSKHKENIRTVGDGECLAGYQRMIHHSKENWYLEYCGFFVACGSLPKFVVDTFDIGDKESEEKTQNLIKEIDTVTESDTASVIGLIKHEKEESISSGAMKSDIIESDKSIRDTMLFKGNWKDFPKVVQFFQKDIPYVIKEVNGDDALVHAVNSQQLLRISFGGLIKFEQERKIIPLEIRSFNEATKVYSYYPVLQEETIDLDESFKVFNLNAAQKTFVGSAIFAGANFTPMLSGNKTTEQLKPLLEIVKSNVDSSLLVGTEYSAEHLQFLAGLANQSIPINRFLDTSVSVSVMQQRYAEMSAYLSESTVGYSKDAARLAKELFWEGKDFSSIDINSDDSYVVLKLKSELDGELSSLAEEMLQRGIVEGQTVSVAWEILSQESKNAVRKWFSLPNAEIKGRTYSEYFSNMLKQVRAIQFIPSGFCIQCYNKLVKRDSNSVWFETLSGYFVWRALAINEKVFYAKSDYCDAVI